MFLLQASRSCLLAAKSRCIVSKSPILFGQLKQSEMSKQLSPFLAVRSNRQWEGGIVDMEILKML